MLKSGPPSHMIVTAPLFSHSTMGFKISSRWLAFVKCWYCCGTERHTNQHLVGQYVAKKFSPLPIHLYTSFHEVSPLIYDVKVLAEGTNAFLKHYQRILVGETNYVTF